MKKILLIIGIIAALGATVWLMPNQKTSAPSLTFSVVTRDVSSGAKLYDVRTADEYKTGHFASALNWSLQDMQASKLPGVAKDTKIYVYCRSGNRSGQAATILKNAGYTNITDLHGLDSVESIGGTLTTS